MHPRRPLAALPVPTWERKRNGSMTENTVSPAAQAVAALAQDVADGTAARAALISKRYGQGVTPAHVALALKVARVMAGEAKPRGGAADRINRVSAALTPASTAADYVSAARAVMEAHAAEQAKRRADAAAERAQLKATLNDRGEALGVRTDAFNAITALDYAQNADKRAAATEGFKSALVRALAAGVPAIELWELLESAAPVSSEVLAA